MLLIRMNVSVHSCEVHSSTICLIVSVQRKGGVHLHHTKLCRFLELLQTNKSKVPAVDVSRIKEVTPLPACDATTPPVLVLGGDNDYSVDKEGLQETADHYGVQPVILPDLAHDLMLV